MKIGLYFGSFNPIHTGHLIIANHFINNTDLEQVWFVVSPHNPLKSVASLLNEYHRLHLVQLAIEAEPKLKASNVEFQLPKPSYTIDTLTYLSEKFPQHSFAVIMGSDSLQNITKWKNFEQLLSDYDVFVYERPGHNSHKDYYSQKVHHVKAPLLDISSTLIRRLIKDRKSIRYLVPDLVNEYILTNNYYK